MLMPVGFRKPTLKASSANLAQHSLSIAFVIAALLHQLLHLMGYTGDTDEYKTLLHPTRPYCILLLSSVAGTG